MIFEKNVLSLFGNKLFIYREFKEFTYTVYVYIRSLCVYIYIYTVYCILSIYLFNILNQWKVYEVIFVIYLCYIPFGKNAPIRFWYKKVRRYGF